MTPRLRGAVTIAAAAVLLGVMFWGMTGLPPFGAYPGPYGNLLNALAPRQRHIVNVVSAVNFDYRGLDTLGEENILFAAVAGIMLILRRDRKKTTPEPLPPSPGRPRVAREDALRAFGLAGIGVTIAFGAYMALHPHLTPGGGFQGGAITSGFAAIAFLALGYEPFLRFVKREGTELFEALGAAGYSAIGIGTLLSAGIFLANVLPLGGEGEFFSTGTIPVINACVAVEVCAGFLLMFAEFARETRVERDGSA